MRQGAHKTDALGCPGRTANLRLEPIPFTSPNPAWRRFAPFSPRHLLFCDLCVLSRLSGCILVFSRFSCFFKTGGRGVSLNVAWASFVWCPRFSVCSGIPRDMLKHGHQTAQSTSQGLVKPRRESQGLPKSSKNDATILQSTINAQPSTIGVKASQAIIGKGNGVMEYWSGGSRKHHRIIPQLHYSKFLSPALYPCIRP
jgi:hypothetical protein